MQTFYIRVTDRRGKYAPKTYKVEADQAFLAYGPATEQYIRDNNHPPYQAGKRMSVYFARFWNERVAETPDAVAVAQ